jgi:AcrR family transcriptional regulator
MASTPQSTRAPDPRPARTRSAIVLAVEKLALAGSDISVNAIVRSAGVSRSAFYAQFTDLDDLALSMLVAQFQAIGEQDVQLRGASLADERAIARLAAERLIAHIDQRRSLYRAALDWHVSARVHEALARAFAERIEDSMSVMGDRVPPERRNSYTARFIGGGALALITDWLRDDAPVPPASMARRLLDAMPEWLVGSA